MPVTPMPALAVTFRVPRNGVTSSGNSSRMNRDNCPFAGTETVTGFTGCEPSIPNTSKVTKFGASDEFAMSIGEISRQASHSAELARRATETATGADTTISALASSAQPASIANNRRQFHKDLHSRRPAGPLPGLSQQRLQDRHLQPGRGADAGRDRLPQAWHPGQGG